MIDQNNRIQQHNKAQPTIGWQPLSPSLHAHMHRKKHGNGPPCVTFFLLLLVTLFFFILQQPSVASLPQCFMMDPDKWKRRREKEIEDAVRSQLPRRERRPVRSLSVNTYIVLFVSPCFYFLLWHRRSSWRHDYHTRKRIQRPASLTLIV